MGKFRKKPVEIEALKYDGTNGREIAEFVGASYVENRRVPVIRTLEGEMSVTSGDWVIKGIKGEFYPCKPDIFEGSYIEVGEETHDGDTMTRVYYAIWDAMGVDKQDPDIEHLRLGQAIVSGLQNSGILFRERAKSDV